MWPILRFSLLFISLLFVGDRIGAWVCGALVSHSQDRYVMMYEKRAPADILVVGNSRADNHFPPALMSDFLGQRVVNLALGGISGVLAEAVVADHIAANGKPKLLVLEPSCLMIEPSLIGDMRLFATYSPRLAGLVRHYTPNLYYAAQVFNLFQYNNDMFLRVLRQTNTRPADRLHIAMVTSALLQVIRARASYKLENFADNEAAFSRLLNYIRGQGIPVRVVITPYLPDQFAKIQNYPAWRDHLLELGVKRGELWDYAARFERVEYFRDGLHMNAEGTKKLLETMVHDGFYRF